MENREKRHYSMEPIIGPGAHVLILGSMPGHVSLMQQQYYANPRNQFWRILSALFGEKAEFNDYNEKCAFLVQHRIALWDSIYQCTRKGSLDSAIKDEEPNDILNLLNKHLDIRLVAFNGSKSLSVFKKHIGFDILKIKDVSHVQLPSSSPTPSRYPKSLDDKIHDWQVIRNYL